MSHNNHTTDNSIRELNDYTVFDYRNMAKDWVDPLPPPVVDQYPVHRDFPNMVHLNVIREDLHGCGLKARWGDLLVSKLEADTIVYVQPRVGYAGVSIAKVAARYGKRVILFCPAAKQVSNHQAVAHEFGAELRFVRIAAMPNLNRLAEAYAKKHGYAFVPLGLRHPLVTAAGVNFADRLAKQLGEIPKEMWFATSTGVLCRAFMVAYGDKCKYNLVAVARNIHKGEKGPGIVYSSPLDFTRKALVMPPYPTVATYDAKVWDFATRLASNGSYIMNVAEDVYPKGELPKMFCSPEWGDLSALDLP